MLLAGSFRTGLWTDFLRNHRKTQRAFWVKEIYLESSARFRTPRQQLWWMVRSDAASVSTAMDRKGSWRRRNPYSWNSGWNSTVNGSERGKMLPKDCFVLRCTRKGSWKIWGIERQALFVGDLDVIRAMGYFFLKHCKDQPILTVLLVTIASEPWNWFWRTHKKRFWSYYLEACFTHIWL